MRIVASDEPETMREPSRYSVAMPRLPSQPMPTLFGALMALEDASACARLQVPDADRAVARRGDDYVLMQANRVAGRSALHARADTHTAPA